jgi:hypothetical protein
VAVIQVAVREVVIAARVAGNMPLSFRAIRRAQLLENAQDAPVHPVLAQVWRVTDVFAHDR